MSRTIRLLFWTVCGLMVAGPIQARPHAATPSTFLRIVTEPADATVTIDGRAQDLPPLVLTNLAPGVHLAIASAPGYMETRRTVELLPGQPVALTLTLERVSGLVLLHSSPAGADVQVDGSDRGRTPVILSDISLGTHRVRFQKPGYLPKELEVEIKDRVPLKRSVDLTSDSATLVLDSVPAGAQVILNSVTKGRTPCRLERIPAGENSVEVSLEGYESYKGTVRLSAGEIQQLTPRLVPLPAELRIVSIPDKARVYVDNQFQGEAPVELKDLPPGAHRVRVELQGMDVMARNVELKQGGRVVEEFRLQSNAGTLQITTEPAGVQVLLNGQDKGSTGARPDESDRLSEPLNLTLLSPGTYEVRLEKKWYVPVTEKVVVERDKTVSLHKTLVRRFVPDCEVRTAADVFRGVLLEVDPAGNVKLEVRPGVVKVIPAADVRVRIPIREDTAPTPAPDKR